MSVKNYDAELHEAIQDLLEEDLLEENSIAHGIAKRVVDLGYDSLSVQQKMTFDKYVLVPLRDRAEELKINLIRDSNPD